MFCMLFITTLNAPKNEKEVSPEIREVSLSVGKKTRDRCKMRVLQRSLLSNKQPNGTGEQWWKKTSLHNTTADQVKLYAAFSIIGLPQKNDRKTRH